MAASVALAVDARLAAAFAAANTALGPSSADWISVYRAMIHGTPTNRYCVIYAGNPARGNSGLTLSNDGIGRFQVTCAASAPDTNRAAELCDWLVEATLDALVDQQFTVDGWTPFVVQQDPIDTFPIPVEVVAGRKTVEQALHFTYLTDRLL